MVSRSLLIPLLAGTAILMAACTAPASSNGAGTPPPSPETGPAAEGPSASAGSSSGGSTPASLAQGAYTTAQAEAGAEVFAARCSECHGLREVRGTDFMFNWEGSSVGRLYNAISRTMPEDDPGSLESAQYLAVVAYILELNDFPAGSSPLGSNMASLFQMRIEH